MKGKLVFFWIALFLILPIFFLGCGSGGSGGSEGSAVSGVSGGADEPPAIQVLPSEHDFGIVTVGNIPTPLEVKILNNRSQDLVVTDIVLPDMDNFDLDLRTQEGRVFKKPSDLNVVKPQLKNRPNSGRGGYGCQVMLTPRSVTGARR